MRRKLAIATLAQGCKRGCFPRCRFLGCLGEDTLALADHVVAVVQIGFDTLYAAKSRVKTEDLALVMPRLGLQDLYSLRSAHGGLRSANPLASGGVVEPGEGSGNRLSLRTRPQIDSLSSRRPK